MKKTILGATLMVMVLTTAAMARENSQKDNQLYDFCKYVNSHANEWVGGRILTNSGQSIDSLKMNVYVCKQMFDHKEYLKQKGAEDQWKYWANRYYK